MAVEVWAKVDVRCLDHIKHQVRHARCLNIHKSGVEQRLWGLESLAAHLDGTAVRKSVVLHQHCCVQSQLSLLLHIVRHKAQLLFQLPHRLKVRRPVERVPAPQQQLDHVPRDVTPSHIQAPSQVFGAEALVHGHDVCHAVARIDHHTSQQALRIQRQHCLRLHLQRAKAVLLEHHLPRPLAVGLGVERGLCQQHLLRRGVFATSRVSLDRHAEPVPKRVVPQVLHVLPVGYNPVFHRVRDLEQRAMLRGFGADHDVL
mmetsp:Transcript_21848/g.70332  ORF Transcript_21848/g.70332 Transcript_21848/m.70332 type:complete len:258 (-) Transcript_21848:182-955(-)